MTEMQKFEQGTQQLQKDSHIKESAKNLMRDFVVLVRETKYNAFSQKFMTKYENINVLVGPKDSVDKVKTKIEHFLKEQKGTFETNFRVQAL